MPSPSHCALATMQALARRRELRNVAAGEVIFRAGDQGASVFGIAVGELRLSRPGGSESGSLAPGRSFGVGALMDPGNRRFGTATAHRESQLLEPSREEFLFALQELPVFALEMLHDMEERLGQLQLGSGDVTGPPPAS